MSPRRSAEVTWPTDAELNILQVLWERGACTVREVHETLYGNDGAGYTTALKLMQIMFEKGIVIRDDSNKTHIYQPNVTREKTQRHMVGKMIDTLFSGSSAQLVMQALGNSKASKQELDDIQRMLDDLKKQ